MKHEVRYAVHEVTEKETTMIVYFGTTNDLEDFLEQIKGLDVDYIKTAPYVVSCSCKVIVSNFGLGENVKLVRNIIFKKRKKGVNLDKIQAKFIRYIEGRETIWEKLSDFLFRVIYSGFGDSDKA